MRSFQDSLLCLSVLLLLDHLLSFHVEIRYREFEEWEDFCRWDLRTERTTFPTIVIETHGKREREGEKKVRGREDRTHSENSSFNKHKSNCLFSLLLSMDSSSLITTLQFSLPLKMNTSPFGFPSLSISHFVNLCTRFFRRSETCLLCPENPVSVQDHLSSLSFSPYLSTSLSLSLSLSISLSMSIFLSLSKNPRRVVSKKSGWSWESPGGGLDPESMEWICPLLWPAELPFLLLPLPSIPLSLFASIDGGKRGA